MGTAANVLVGSDGLAFFAPAGSTLPTTPDEALDGAFVDLGLVNVDGLVEGHAQTTKPILDWNGDTVRTVLSDQTDTFKVTFLETNPDTLEVYHGPQDDIDTVVEVKKQQGQRGSWVFETTDGDNIVRLVIPDGQVSTNDDISYKVDEPIAYGVTLTCYPDTDRVTVKKYIQVGAPS